MFNLLRKTAAAAAGAAATEIKGANGENTDALEALSAAAALAAAGDGDIGSNEKAKGLSLIKKHKRIASIYKESDVEKIVEAFFKQAEDSQGRQQLARELKDVVGDDKFKEIREDCYLIAKEVCLGADGKIDDAEQKQLDRIAKLLGVNPEDFEF
jgi:tellurite resistance protein TerB